MIITNILFLQPKWRRYTWTILGSVNRYHLDYILVRELYRNEVKQSKSYLGADIDSDYNYNYGNKIMSLKVYMAKEKSQRKNSVLKC